MYVYIDFIYIYKYHMYNSVCLLFVCLPIVFVRKHFSTNTDTDIHLHIIDTHVSVGSGGFEQLVVTFHVDMTVLRMINGHYYYLFLERVIK